MKVTRSTSCGASSARKGLHCVSGKIKAHATKGAEISMSVQGVGTINCLRLETENEEQKNVGGAMKKIVCAAIILASLPVFANAEVYLSNEFDSYVPSIWYGGARIKVCPHFPQFRECTIHSVDGSSYKMYSYGLESCEQYPWLLCQTFGTHKDDKHPGEQDITGTVICNAAHWGQDVVYNQYLFPVDGSYNIQYGDCGY